MMRNLQERAVGPRKLLIPFAMAYSAVMTVRNVLYDKKILQIKHFPLPVISVGNITAGGTGKSPVISWLAGQLSPTFKKPVIISRGYGRSSKGALVVSDGAGQVVSASIGGDEPVMIAGQNKDVPVIVAEDRREGAQLALEHFNPDLLLLDDAFQHRRIGRNVDIVLIDAMSSLNLESVLPAGNLREPKSQLKRADLILFTRCNNGIPESDLECVRKHFTGPVFESQFFLERFIDVAAGGKINTANLSGKKILAVSGIARPQQFERSIQAMGLNCVEHLSFRDHYHYREPDFEEIRRIAAEKKCDTILTTEKDAVKLSAFRFEGIRLVSAGLELRIKEVEKFTEYLRNSLDMN